jgi:hypothetical protein
VERLWSRPLPLVRRGCASKDATRPTREQTFPSTDTVAGCDSRARGGSSHRRAREPPQRLADGDWEGWLVFFLDGVTDTAAEATITVRSILDLRERDRQRIAELGQRAANAYRLHDHLLSDPLTTAADVQRVLYASQPTANRLLRDLGTVGILTEATGRPRNQRWLYADYLALFRPSER